MLLLFLQQQKTVSTDIVLGQWSTTQIPGTTVPAATPANTFASSVVISFTIQQEFVEALSNPQSQEFQTLAASTVKMCNLIFGNRYQTLFNQTTVIAFTAGGNSGFSSSLVNFTKAQVELVFTVNSITSVPNSSYIVDMLRTIFSVNLVPNSITVIVFALQVTFVYAFSPALNDPKSSEYILLALTVTTSFNSIYSKKYGILFIKTIVISFMPISRNRIAATDTQAQVKLVFNETAIAAATAANDTATLPAVNTVTDTLKEAVNNPNSTLNLTVDANSIIVKKLATDTTVTTATSVALTIVSLEFKTSDTFTQDLSDSTSQGFKTRASLTKTVLEKFYKTAFQTFISLTVTKFRPGSVITTINLEFRSSFVPNGTSIGAVLIDAAHNITEFTIDPTSVTVNGTAVTSGGVSSKTSLLTASYLVVLALLLSR
ncbi:hypothetical protein DPEC_G00288160 [Dallia pectoralis]|uniref:Uncharacterized protein n=1 Tax=Dallia pectoralis TaxID=75939 RepID=A0ACC2FKF9_DALPE|nr:hypothetical protein DPEC_G00288160 [Dallia pectoralis]